MLKLFKVHPLILSLTAGLLLSAAWYIHPFFSFVGFVPVLLLNHRFDDSQIKRKGLKFFFYCYFAFLVWNFTTTWWILNSTLVGALLAFFINSFLMCIPVLLFRRIRNLSKNSRFEILGNEFILIPFWLTFEYLHFNWDLTWTWLNIGNSFAMAHYLVQWFEYTGILGGSLWVLLINILIFKSITAADKQLTRRYLLLSLLTVIVPCLISLIIYFSYIEKGQPVEIVAVQPNIDPYTEKFAGTEKFIPYNEQLNRLIRLSESKITPRTKYVAWPETSLPVGFDEDLIEDQAYIKIIRAFLGRHKGTSLVTGGDTYKIYLSQYDATSSARYGEGVGYYDYFNTALQIEENTKIKIYHKSKLVPGVEQMPYPALFKWIEKLSINMGGMTGSLGTQKERTAFFNKDNIGIAPVICYESIFGEYVGQYIKNGAGFIFIITNDGWWGNTPGHTQHLAYARLRAIENRRSIARAANTGISAFLDQKGDMLAKNNYWMEDAIRMEINENKIMTFYTVYGDYLGIISKYICYLVIALSIASVFINRFKTTNR